MPLLEKKSLILLASWKLVFKFFMWLEGDYFFCNKYDLLRTIKRFSHLLSIPQVQFGVLQVGNYGVSQSHKRAFIWAASPEEFLPEWPDPMHVFSSSQPKISFPGGL